MKKENIGDWYEAACSAIRTILNKRVISSVEKKYKGKVDFLGIVEGDELSFQQKDGNGYSPSPVFCKKLCSKARICDNDSIMDLGCGKGFAMYVFGQYPFRNVYGVELDDRLSDIAKGNISRIYSDQAERFHVYNIDATKLMEDETTRNALNDSNYIYIFNSFPAEVTEKVVNVIKESVLEVPRKVVIWYVSPGPGCIEPLLASGVFHLARRHSYFLYPYSNVYEFVNR